MMRKKILWILLGLIILLCVGLQLAMNNETRQANKNPAESTEAILLAIDWVQEKKKPYEYSWEEYQALSLENKDRFFAWFGSKDAFEAWMESVKPVETMVPDFKWKKAKNPDTFTWEEYQNLNAQEQEAFYLWFASVEEFEAWMELVTPVETTAPAPQWNKVKKPSEYTWEEYQALSFQEQEAFFLWFDSTKTFEEWMESVKPVETITSPSEWDYARKPNEYTWEEYQALSPQEQEAFYLWFSSTEAFEAWMRSVNEVDTTAPAIDWDKAEKKPNEYTWEEYQALSPQDQDSFFLWFESTEAFEAWMDNAMIQ